MQDAKLQKQNVGNALSRIFLTCIFNFELTPVRSMCVFMAPPLLRQVHHMSGRSIRPTADRPDNGVSLPMQWFVRESDREESRYGGARSGVSWAGPLRARTPRLQCLFPAHEIAAGPGSADLPYNKRTAS